MSRGKEPFEHSITSTLVGPLYGRAKYSELYPDILQDIHAKKLMKAIRNQYPEVTEDFVRLEKFVNEFYGLTFIIRAHIFDVSVSDYIKNHPETCVINLGCGLDTTFSRVDNGKITWYDLDLPEVLDYRRNLLSDGERVHHISKSILDLSWLEDITYDKEKGIFFIAGGLFQYFDENKVSDIISKIAGKFPRGELMFDNPTWIGNKTMNLRLKRVGVEGIDFLFHIKNPKKQILKWSDKIQLKEFFSYYEKTPRNPRWKIRTRIMMNLCDIFYLAMFVHLKFKE